MRKWTIALLIALPLLANQNAKVILSRVDSVMNAPKDREMKMIMILIDKHGEKSIREGESYQKGDSYRLIRFTKPADQRGIAFLSLPHDVMYVYFPAFKKIRRIASHVKNSAFAGTDFTYDDLSTFKYSKDYNPTLLRATDSTYVLKLTPRPGVKKDYGYLKMWVDKKTYHILKIEFYDKNGNLWKVLTFKNIRKIKNYWISSEMDMTDVKKQHTTIMKLKDIKLDTGIPESFFSKRTLRRMH